MVDLPDINDDLSITANFAIDSDGDGVADDVDQCPDTPPNAIVDDWLSCIHLP